MSNRFIDLADDLEALPGREVDLPFECVIKDPDLIARSGAHRRLRDRIASVLDERGWS